jgi:hypothetical protein
VAKKINPNFETIFNSLRDKLKVFSTSFFNNLKNKCGTLATITLFNNYIEVKDNMSLSFKLNDRFLNFKLTSCIRDTKFNSTIRLYNLLKGESLFPNGCEISYETRTGVTSCNCTLSNQIESIFTCRMKIHQRAKPLNLQIFQVENPEADSF